MLMGRYAQLSQDTLNRTIDQLFLKTDDSYQSERAHFEFTLYYNHLPKYCFTFTIDISCKNRIESYRI